MHKIFASIRSVKAVFVLVAVVIALGAITGGTLAWVFARSNPVQNTFTPAVLSDGLSLTLKESDTGDGDGDETTNTYPMTPGAQIAKDPVVTLSAGNMPVWLFVRLNESANLSQFITYTVAAPWQPLPGVANVYYCEAQQTAEAQKFPVLENDAVHVREDVTNEMLRALTKETYPQLTLEAFAVQQQGVPTASDAWSLVTGEPVSTDAAPIP